MKSKVKNQSVQKLSLSVGNFIRYWGFRRIHGAVWTQVYLSKTPVSCTDLTERLGLSKALISPALEELCQYHLIHEVPPPNGKTKLYVAAENISEVIVNVLKTREAKMLQQITKDFNAIKQDESDPTTLDDKKLESLGEMIFSANMMLEILVSQKDLLKLPTEFNA